MAGNQNSNFWQFLKIQNFDLTPFHRQQRSKIMKKERMHSRVILLFLEYQQFSRL